MNPILETGTMAPSNTLSSARPRYPPRTGLVVAAMFGVFGGDPSGNRRRRGDRELQRMARYEYASVGALSQVIDAGQLGRGIIVSGLWSDPRRGHKEISG